MADEARSASESRDFAGMASAVDPEDLAGGAAEVQLNLVSLVTGELATRAGYRVVTFEAE